MWVGDRYLDAADTERERSIHTILCGDETTQADGPTLQNARTLTACATDLRHAEHLECEHTILCCRDETTRADDSRNALFVSARIAYFLCIS